MEPAEKHPSVATATADEPWAVGGLHARPIDRVPALGKREVGCLCAQVYDDVPLYCPLHTPPATASNAPSEVM